MSKEPPLLQHLRSRIEAEGPLPLPSFMADVLMHPEHGYYVTQTAFGRGGDFITAPEISQMFGELLGIWAADTWDRLGRPAPFALVELGPGRGTLMADVWRVAKSVPGFADALDIHMVEASPRLRAMQTRAVDAPITHHDDISTLPGDRPLIILANEFLDALPVQQFQKTAKGWQERLVDVNRTQPEPATPWLPLRFVLGDAVQSPAKVLGPRVRGAALGALVEKSPACEAVVEALSRRLATQGGAALFIDYGPANSAIGDSLQAVRAHKFVHVFDDPGTADLTAHVDFEPLAAVARAGGLKAFPITPQGVFLSSMGIEARAGALMRGASPKEAQAIQSARRRLTHPDQMGQLFKVLAIAHPGVQAVAGLPMEEAPQ